jgi:hypothetical protein
VNEEIQEVSVSELELPELAPGEQYLVRYRIVSEDRNRSSAWSPITRLDPGQES